MAQHLNKTHIEHTLIAVMIQLLLWPLLGPVAAGCVAVAILLGREIAQHEYKEGILRGWQWGQPLKIPWYTGMAKHWSRDSVLDVLVPLTGCTLLAGLAHQLL